MSTTTPKPCTTAAKSKRHYAFMLVPDRHAPRHPGRTGRTACGNSGMDEERANWERNRWGARRKQLVVADLPECKQCAKTLVAIARDLGSAATVPNPKEQ